MRRCDATRAQRSTRDGARLLGASGGLRASVSMRRLLRTVGRGFRGLGVTARYELDAAVAFDANERGYRLAREQGDDELRRLAVQLGYDAYSFRGPAEAQGWVERAGMLVEGRLRAWPRP